jgi:dipeptidyl aminopeptidase/acylaminoacyl peptidase
MTNKDLGSHLLNRYFTWLFSLCLEKMSRQPFAVSWLSAICYWLRRSMLKFILPLTFAIVSVFADEASIRPNDNLVLNGIPPIPVTVAENARRYTESRQARFSSWNPSTREMLILTRFADTAQVHLVKMPGGERKQLTFFPDRVSAASFPEENDDYFVLNKDVGGSEFFQNYRFDLKSGEITLLTDGKSRNSLGVWSHHGDLLAYSSTRRNGKDSDLYVIAGADKETDHLIAQVNTPGWEPIDWAPDDQTLLVMQEISINETNLFLIDVSSGKMTRVNPLNANEKVAYGAAVFSKDAKYLYLTTNQGSEFQRLERLDLRTNAFEPLTSQINWNVELISLSTDGSQLAFVTNEDGISRLYLLDTASNQYSQVTGIPDGVITTLDWHHDNRTVAFTISSANAPSDVFCVDAQSKAIERWTESETGGIPAETFVQPELVKWPTFDGRIISGFLYRNPMNSRKMPVIIDIHGGPEAQFRPLYLGRYNYLLNEVGVAMIFPNVRGSDGYGKSFLDLDNGMKREDSVKDIGALLDWIKTRPDLDSDRVMITGGSYGGYMTLACSFHYADRIRCSLDVVGISNFVTFLEHTEAYRRDLRRVEYGDERDPAMREFLLRISPVNNIDKISKPLFIVAGQNDPRVPVTEGQQMVDALRSRGLPVWYLAAKDEGHGFAKKQNADFEFYATIKFIEDYLLKSDGK